MSASVSMLFPELERAAQDWRLPAASSQRWMGLHGSARGLAICEAARRFEGLVLVVTEDAHNAYVLEQEIQFYAAGNNLEILSFPDWETLPYDLFSPHEDIVSQRLETLYRLPELERGILIVPVTTLLARVAPRTYLDAHSLLIKPGQRFKPEVFRERLERAGYQCVSQVMSHGEFAVRGSLVDLYPTGADLPFRIDLFDDEIESIRTFDAETQLSRDIVSEVRLLPAREYPMDADAIKLFRQNFRQTFDCDPNESSVYQQVSRGTPPAGVEYYLPLFHASTQTLFQYLPKSVLRLIVENVMPAAQRFEDEVRTRYEQRRHDRDRPLLAPERLFVSMDELRAALGTGMRVELGSTDGAAAIGGRRIDFHTEQPPPLAIDMHQEEAARALQNFVQVQGRVLFVADSAGRREMLLQTLRKSGLKPQPVEGWQDFQGGDLKSGIAISPMDQGLLLSGHSLAVITEAQLFGRRVQQRRRRVAARDPATLIRDLTDLSLGAPVVHEDHGVGRYIGLTTLNLNGEDNEFVTLEYSGGDKLYVPVWSLHLIGRYTGADPDHAPLHRLGNDQWEKAKRKAAEKAHDVAAELLEVGAKRATRKGLQITLDDDQYRQFAAGFAFEETPDQAKAIEDVLSDLGQSRPMDRLVCGDVGFGKTEVAMRAAFAVALSGRQVAVLAPTTLLAQQHYANFCDRFAEWPVRVEILSRFRSAKEVEAASTALNEGRADIVIGTHKLLQGNIRFKNLGLVIVDEEHRFGVRDKEKLKALRAEVHILTLTATPIPRTLNMSLNGLRDLSIIATPPANRHAIKTFVSEWSDSLIQEAMQRELKRGGQVYFLHNEVKSIGQIAREIETLMPQARVQVAHGQMRERDLEQVMLDFYHQRFSVLVCTTIIESGIDVPNANTIIINRADKLGLSQLHQIRGRVGRSHHRAYAFLLTPPRSVITSDAVKRLDALESLEDLGVGFTLATHDLEIRGAGELLGDEQSGQIQEVGFGLYQELLNRAIAALRSGRLPDTDDMAARGAEVDLGTPALLPPDYIPDVHMRLVLYKRISSAVDAEALRELQVEMIDRFGLLPERAKLLFALMELRQTATAMGIRKLEAHERGVRVMFGQHPNIDFPRLIKMIQKDPKRYVLDGRDKLRFNQNFSQVEQRLEGVRALLSSLALPTAA